MKSYFSLVCFLLLSYSTAAQLTITYAYDTNGNRATRTATPTVPDLTPIIYFRPNPPIVGTKPITLVVEVDELNGAPTSGLITVYVTKDSRLSLSFAVLTPFYEPVLTGV